MKTRLAALLCALLLTAGALPAAALEGEASRAADALVTLGLAAAPYDTDAPATRAQAAVLLAGLAGGAPASAGAAVFTDVPASLAPAVNYAARQGWVSGVTAREFRPSEPITANAWAAFLLRMLGWSDGAGDFAVSGAAAFARRIGLFSAAYDGPLTQGELALTAMDALAFCPREGDGTLAARLAAGGAVPRAAASALGLLDGALTARQAADRLSAAVFQLDTYETEADWAHGLVLGEASGFFITPEGLAVTNYHSIEGAVRGEAILTTGDVYEVTGVVYCDAGADIAVVQVSRTALEGRDTSAFACLELAPSGAADLRAGDAVYALGCPLGLGLAVSAGIVSDAARPVERYALPCVMNTADISEGSSGGALVNVYGQAAAVTSGAYVYGNGMYLAVPIDPVLTADLTAEPRTLAQVAEEAAGA